MMQYFLIVALCVIFCSVVSGQNINNNGPNSNYGTFQNNPDLYQNEQPYGQNFPTNGYESQSSGVDGSQRRRFQQQQPSFQQPSPWIPDSTPNRGGDYFPQSQGSFQRQNGGGTNLGWSFPSQSSRNMADDQIGNYPSQSSFGPNMQPSKQAPGYWQVSNQETRPQQGLNGGRRRRLRKRRRRRRKNRQGTIEEADTRDQSPGTGKPSLSNQEDSFDDKKPTEENTQIRDESSNNDDQIPADIPNDYPGYSYPPNFFGDMLDGLDDSNKESNSQHSEMVVSDNSSNGSSDNYNSSDTFSSNDNYQIPPGIPNDYPDYTYPPDFFPDMLEGLDNSTMASDYEDSSTDMMEDFDSSPTITTIATITTANYEGTCPDNEEETDCMSPCNTCAANCQNCRFMMCQTGCDCFDGYKRDIKGDCIHASLCPPCASPTSTTESSISD